MAKIDIYALAKATQELPAFSKIRYTQILKRVVKNGFSEIALYKAVTDHCDENDISYEDMAEDMHNLLVGCAENVFFPKMDNNFGYLRGMYHDLRYGDLSRDEPKCAEQRGLFLCGRCYTIKDENLRSNKKSDKRSCKDCANAAANLANKRSTEKKRAQLSSKEAPEPMPHQQPLITPEEAVEMVEVNTAPVQKREPVVIDDSRIEGIKVKEVMADANGATITIECETASLGEVLMAVQSL